VVPPTPTAEEIAAKQQADEARMRALIDAQVSRVMAEQEEKMRSELLERQKKIEDLQRQLRAAERTSQGSDASAEAQREAQREAEEIKRRIAAEEEAKRKREQEMQAERDRAEAVARKRAEEAAQQQQPTPEPEVATVQPTAAPARQVPSPVPPPTQVPSPTPQPQAQAQPTQAPRPTQRPAHAQAQVQVRENQFVDPSQVSTPPEILKKSQVTWSPIASRSRRRGVVIVQATVNAMGRVDEAKILRADDDGFGIPESAMNAAREFVFKPATKDGVRVKTFATITIPYNFALTRRP
jgi:TonB family protein